MLEHGHGYRVKCRFPSIWKEKLEQSAVVTKVYSMLRRAAPPDTCSIPSITLTQRLAPHEKNSTIVASVSKRSTLDLIVVVVSRIVAIPEDQARKGSNEFDASFTCARIRDAKELRLMIKGSLRPAPRLQCRQSNQKELEFETHKGRQT